MKFYSISEYPGRTGQYYYSAFFQLHQIQAEYIPIGSSVEQFSATLLDLQQKQAQGISISMPFKKRVIDNLDLVDASVLEYGSCNTVVCHDGQLLGYNCDLAGVEHVCEYVMPGDTVHILGAGAMGKMFQTYLERNKYCKIKVYSRSLGNWSARHAAGDVLINCTACGTANDHSPVDFIPDDIHTVIDLAIKTGQLQDQCHNQSRYITGKEFYMYQFMRQYEIYTGVRPSIQDFLEIQSRQ